MVVISVVSELRRERKGRWGQVPPGTDWCGHTTEAADVHLQESPAGFTEE